VYGAVGKGIYKCFPEGRTILKAIRGFMMVNLADGELVKWHFA